MPDLNDWVLEYNDTSLPFGTLESGYPFTAQVDFADMTPRSNDMQHPNSDGLVMGIDRLGGQTLTFSVGVVRDQPYAGDAWDRPLDLLSEFRRVWRADELRDVPGTYATIANLARERLTYGRPRKVGPITDRVRKGNAGVLATFEANSPNFYSIVERVASIGSSPAAAGGLRTPIIPPFSTVGSSSEVSPMVNAGDVKAWPVIEMYGPGSNFSVELLRNNTVLWALEFPYTLAFDQTLRIDTRPWSRSATIQGNPANGRIFGTALQDCTIPVGNFWARFKVKSQYGTAGANLRWRDAFASL